MGRFLTFTIVVFLFTVFYSYSQCETDSVQDYDGNWYYTVPIGNQCWMAENLRTTHYADGTPIPKVTGDAEWESLNAADKGRCWYNNDSAANAETYGALYTWAAAINGASSSNSNPSGVQGVCPDGWHLPSDKEWKELEMTLGMSQSTANSIGWRGTNQGSKLADSADLWKDGHLKHNPAFGTSGFAALPGGLRGIFGRFHDIGDYGYWWSSHEESSALAYRRRLDYSNSVLNRSYFKKESGFSVRCVRDE